MMTKNKTDAIETKFCSASAVKLTDADQGVITGYGAIFGNKDLGGDIIVPGAFLKSINDIRASGFALPMYVQHDRMHVAGVWNEIVEDQNGLMVTGRLNLDKQLGRDLLSDLKFGSVTGLSIGYRTMRDAWDDTAVARMLLECKLYEISAVTTPMNPLARITAVKGDQAEESADGDGNAPQTPRTIREFEKFLREAGFSHAQAKAIATRGFKAADPDPRDEDGGNGAEALQRLAAAIKSHT